MEPLHVSIGPNVREAMCAAFDSATRSIEAEFYSIDDDRIIDGLNAAALRQVSVCLHVEGRPDRFGGARRLSDEQIIARLLERLDPRISLVVERDRNALTHGKAVVVDGDRAFVATANPNPHGLGDPGAVCVEDDDPADAAAVGSAIHGHAQAAKGSRIRTGPLLRSSVDHLLHAQTNLRIAAEDLSDPRVVAELAERRQEHKHDRVLVNTTGAMSPYARHVLARLVCSGVDVRTLDGRHMHEKYIDDGDSIYLGSANLTYYGLDESREIGIVAPATDFGAGASALRADFDRMWSAAKSLMRSANGPQM